jgi:hypothetical protein
MAGRDWLTYDDFADRIGDGFDVPVADGESLPMELVEATVGSEPGGPGPDGRERLQFSLVFRGPATQVLPQRTYQLTHTELGHLELFLVPLGPDDEGMRYEAAFA